MLFKVNESSIRRVKKTDMVKKKKLMPTRHPKCHFQQLDAEPRPAGYTSSVFPGGPPPSYRSSTNADDSSTFSSTESSSGAATTASTIKRRNSWTNLIESDENLYRKDFPYYAPPPPSSCTPTTTTTTTSGTSTVPPYYRLPSTTVYGNDYRSLERYNLNGRYAKHFTPIYLLNSAGDPIAVSKLELSRSGSLCKLNGAEPPAPNRLKRDRMNELRQWSREPKNLFCLFVTLLLTIAVCMTIAILLSHNHFMIYGQESRTFSWLPPMAFRDEQKNPTIVRLFQNDNQARFEIQGNLPIKNDYTAVYDFRTRKVAIIDATLKNNGRNLVCFVLNMNMSSMPDKYALEIGAQNALKRKEQTQGWEETWNFIPGSYFGNTSTLFDPPIPECNEARWILLNYTNLNQREQKCSDCYDFCLPELGLERDRLRAETFLNIVRRDCFYLFVPEWRSFASAYSSEQNQRDFEQFYHSGQNPNSGNGDSSFGNAIQNVVGGIVQPITDHYRNFESKWISLQQVPQQISNLTSEAVSQMGNLATNVQSGLSDVAQNIFGYQQQQNGKSGSSSYDGNMPSSGYNNFNFGAFNSAPQGSGNNGFSTGNDNMKPLLPMPPPSYPAQPKQQQQQSSSSADGRDFYPGGILPSYKNTGRQQSSNFPGNNGNGQFMLSRGYSGSGYNPQLSSGQSSSNVLPNTMRIDNEANQPHSIYDQPVMNTPSYGQSNPYTPQPGVGGYVQQTTGDQNSGGINQQSTNDQGWITVG